MIVVNLLIFQFFLFLLFLSCVVVILFQAAMIATGDQTPQQNPLQQVRIGVQL